MWRKRDSPRRPGPANRSERKRTMNFDGKFGLKKCAIGVSICESKSDQRSFILDW